MIIQYIIYFNTKTLTFIKFRQQLKLIDVYKYYLLKYINKV